MNNQVLRASAMSGLRWTTATRVATQLITWALTFFVVRLLSPSDYGLVAMATVITGYLAIWNELGFGVTIVQRHIEDDQILRKVFSVLLLVGIALFALTAALAPVIASAFGEPRVVPLTLIAALHFLVMPGAVVPQALLSMKMRFRALGTLTLTASLMGAVVTVALAYLQFGAYALMLGTLAAAFARTAGLAMLARRVYMPSLRLSGVRDLMANSGLVLIERTIWYWNSLADVVIVGRVLGVSSLGVYSLGNQLALMPMDRASEVVNSVALPAYASIKEDIGTVREGYLKALRIGSTLAFPIFWGFALVSDDLVRVALGPKWLEAILIIQLLCIALPLRTVGTLASPMLMALGKVGAAIWLAACNVVVVTPGLVIGVHWGIIGVAAAWSLFYPISFVINSFRLSKVVGMTARSILLPLGVPAICGIAMVLAVWATQTFVLGDAPPIVRLAVATPLGAFVYAGALWAVAAARYREATSLVRAMAGGR